MGKTREELAATAKARADVYRLLATVFRAEPTVALVGEFRSEAFSDALADLGFPLDGAFHERPVDEIAEDLAIEYTRLFIGPGHRISPHESVHLDMGRASENMLWSRQTVAVKRFIEATGLQYDDAFSGLPDHISAEFEFMANLAERESRSWQEGDEEDASWFSETEQRFLREHLLAWVPRFCERVIAMAELPFYRRMAETTIAFMDFEQLGLGDQPAPVIAAPCASDQVASPS